jgi:hypothetical protein
MNIDEIITSSDGAEPQCEARASKAARLHQREQLNKIETRDIG